MDAIRTILTLAILSVLAGGCRKELNDSHSSPLYATQRFHDYWHAGKAEISSYDLIQSRYGEQRRGKAVLVFVTEDLSKKLQVKLDDPAGRNKVNVLKLNFTKNFITGIYPYSLMLSVFTPTDRAKEPSSLKVTMSAQEWCGQVYSQLNLRGNRYAIKTHSYFEEEADQRFSIRQNLLEDEVWNLIRLDHENLPQGDLDMIPGLFHTRLNHMDVKVLDAKATKSDADSAFVYTISFPNERRTLSIHYEKIFPFKILGWEETWIEMGKTMETRARLDKTIFTDYWTKNKNEFLHLRDSLNLHTDY